MTIRSKLAVSFIGAAALVVAYLPAAEPAQAATFVVNTTADTTDADGGTNGTCADGSGKCSLRAAVQTANFLGGSQTIVLPAGTYNLTIGGQLEDNAATGDLDIK